MRIHHLLLAASLALVACGGEERRTGASGGSGGGGFTLGPLPGGGGSGGCVPLSICPPGTCGEQPDRCGGTLDCGACSWEVLATDLPRLGLLAGTRRPSLLVAPG